MTKQFCNVQMTAYDHWHCQRERHLFGAHRFNNYTQTRFPQVWRIGQLGRVWSARQRIRSWGPKPDGSLPALPSYSETLWPASYKPIDHDIWPSSIRFQVTPGKPSSRDGE